MVRTVRQAREGGQVREFKQMVKALHDAGIEVILDVVYNHTAEGNQLGPTLSFRGIANVVLQARRRRTRATTPTTPAAGTPQCVCTQGPATDHGLLAVLG